MTTRARAITRSILVVLFVTLYAHSSLAQGVGAIGGTVTDGTGAALPGTTVTLSATEATIGSNQETITDERGAYQFLRLVPGRYIVRAELVGFRRVELPDIVVNADTTARADLRLEVGGIEEAIVVSGTAPLIDTTTAMKQIVLSREELQALPNRTDLWSMARVIPSVVIGKVDVGGSEAFLSSTVTVRGSSNENKWMIDGMDMGSISGNGTGNPFLYLDPFAFEESNFQMGQGSAELAYGGLTFNMVTRTGTNQLRGGAKMNYTPPAGSRTPNYSAALRDQLLANVPPLVRAANPDLQPQADIRLMADGGAYVSGPVVRDRLWFSGSYHDQRLEQYRLGNYDAQGKPVIDDNLMRTTAAKLAWQATKSAQLSYFHNLQYKLIGHRGGGTFADDRARQYNWKMPTVNQVKFTSPISSTMTVDVGYSRFVGDDVFTKRPEVKLGDVSTFDTTTQVNGVALATYESHYSRKYLYRGSFSWFSSTHEIRTGYEFMTSHLSDRSWSLSGMRALFAAGVPTAVNTFTNPITADDARYPGDIPYLIDQYENVHGVYIQERWKPHGKLTVNMGMRYDTSSSYQPRSCRPDNVFLRGECFDKVTAPSFGDFNPRFNVAYDVTGDGRTALKFSANRYSQPLSLSIVARLDPVALVSDQRQWLDQSRCGAPGVLGCDRNGDRIPQLNELGPSPGYSFPGVNSSYADDIRRPASNEYIVELQHELPQAIVASVGYVRRQVRRNIGQQNTAVPLSAWIGPTTVTEVTSGQTVQVWRRPSTATANLFYNSEEFDTDYQGLDVMLNKRMSDGWSMMGGATFGAVRDATRGGNRNDPHIINSFDTDVRTVGDRPWSYRLSGVYELPYQVFLSGTWMYQAGAPETTTVLVTNQTISLPQGNQAVLAAPVGDVRYPNLAQLDFNIRKKWSLGRRTIVPRLELFNATNSGTINAWVTQLGPTYHRPSAMQRGRLIKMELAVEF